jgi:hypothetical protein
LAVGRRSGDRRRIGGFVVGHRGSNADPTVRFHQVAFRRGLIGGAVFANGGKTIVYSCTHLGITRTRSLS